MAMSSNLDLVQRLRVQAKCVFLATEQAVAEDLADALLKAADEIERLRQFEPSPHPSDV